MATRNAALMISRIPAWPLRTRIAERKAISGRAALAARAVLAILDANPESFLVSPCRQYVSRIGEAAPFGASSGTESFFDLDLVHQCLQPAFENPAGNACNTMVLYLPPSGSYRFSAGGCLMEPRDMRRFGHVVRSWVVGGGWTAVAAATCPERHLGVNLNALRATSAGRDLERIVFAHRFGPSSLPGGADGTKSRDDGVDSHLRDLLPQGQWNPQSLKSVDEAASEVTRRVLVSLVQSRLEKTGHCTVDWLQQESGWRALSHILPSFSQTVADSVDLDYRPPCVFLRDPALARAAWKQRAEHINSTDPVALFGLDSIASPPTRRSVAIACGRAATTQFSVG